MANFNKIILVGNLTRDPQSHVLPSQTQIVEFGLAVNRKWKSKDGQQREDTCFIDCRCMGRTAETIQQYLHKGSPVLVEGRLEYDTWEGKDGQKRSKHRVFVERFQFIGENKGGGSPARSGGGSDPPPPDYDAGGSGDVPF